MRTGAFFIVLATLLCDVAFAKKDFKGLFGSYRREKFTENEANSSDFGMDIMLSTLLPLSPLVKSEETTRGGAGTPMHYATFFDIETSFFFTLDYHWELFANIGYYSYETRKENTVFTNPQLPLFHQFEMEVVPLVFGVRYRLTTDDIVPYIGAGAGPAYVHRKGFYDYNPVLFKEQFMNVLAAEVIVGVEFFFSSNAGIRLETAAHYLRLPADTYDALGSGAAPGSAVGQLPILNFQANPWSIRYASGLFFLF